MPRTEKNATARDEHRSGDPGNAAGCGRNTSRGQGRERGAGEGGFPDAPKKAGIRTR